MCVVYSVCLYEVMLNIYQAAIKVGLAQNVIEAILTRQPLDHAENTGSNTEVKQFRGKSVLGKGTAW